MIMDHYHEKWWEKVLEPVVVPLPCQPATVPYPWVPQSQPPAPRVTDAEIKEFRDLLEKARKYDKDHGQPDCDLDEKREKVRKLAEELGVDVSFV